ncbi:hypothetical protein LJY25_04245 [Hymenobacter sp. BT175]|uniref:hypothetical protein n=1 Tax=Hymenobacter translucens TaxID=2886507 RepID=UPI001D0E62D7|nr:hypothetical protein [Hymenobacter translucens]MCC2545644.1 hypothetical protein [Hymenobacter translucens]
MNTTRFSDFLELSHRPDLGVMFVRWMRPVTSQELQQGYLKLLEESAAVQCRAWLLDARRRRNTDGASQRWMLTELLPMAVTRLGGRVYLAFLLAPVHLRDAASDDVFPPAEFFIDKPYAAERFTDEGPALAWLVAGLQAPITGVA